MQTTGTTSSGPPPTMIRIWPPTTESSTSVSIPGRSVGLPKPAVEITGQGIRLDNLKDIVHQVDTLDGVRKITQQHKGNEM